MPNENLNPILDKKDENLKTEVTDEVDGSDFAEEELALAPVRTRGRLAKDIFEFFEMLVITACAVLFLFTFVARISIVDGASMAMTLEDGDKLIVSDLFYTPTQGDIVVFQDLDSGRDGAIVKRIIATGGQTVTLAYEHNFVRVTVDGEVLDETDYRYYDLSLPASYRNRYQGIVNYTVPEGCVFVMGDNTYNSEDSRGAFGYIEEEKILGRVVFRLMGENFSNFFDKFGTIN